jgi:hypothetical protein
MMGRSKYFGGMAPVSKTLAVCLSFGGLAVAVSACSASSTRSDETVGVQRQALAPLNLAFQITGIKTGATSHFEGLVDLYMKSNWDQAPNLHLKQMFRCGLAFNPAVPCTNVPEGTFHPYPQYPLNHTSLGLDLQNPELFTRSTTVDLDGPNSKLIVDIGTTTPYFINNSYKIVLNIDHTTGVVEPDLSSSSNVYGFRHNGLLIGAATVGHSCVSPTERPECSHECAFLEQGWEICYQLPVACKREIAGNNFDDDCDGVVDDCQPGASQVCSTTVSTAGCSSGLACPANACPGGETCVSGTCASVVPGHSLCDSAGVPGVCIPDSKDTVPEVDNDEDDDCDGSVDECNAGQLTMSCTMPPLSACPGDAGIADCSGAPTGGGGFPGICKSPKIDQVPEILNKVDDDCDGKIDECNPGQTVQTCAAPFGGCFDPQPGEAACSGPTQQMCIPFGVTDTTGTCKLPGCVNNPSGDFNGNGNIDDDGDGLRDCWEANGEIVYFNNLGNRITSPLPNANPLRKNLYLEIDFMQGHRPRQKSLDAVVDAFKRSPVPNPDGSTGIDLFIDVDEELPHWDLIHPGFCLIDSLCEGVEADNLREDHFEDGTPKIWAFRYAIFAHWHSDNPGSSGNAEVDGNDLIVSLGGDYHPGARCDVNDCGDWEAASLMHEFGHNLNLGHGGDPEDNNLNYKPQYLSVMNYAYQENRGSGRPLDYSHGQMPGLNESSLSERYGVGPNGRRVTAMIRFGNDLLARAAGPINWNNNFLPNTSPPLPSIETVPVGVDISGGGFDTLKDHNDWDHINYSVNFSENSVAGVHTKMVSETSTLDVVTDSDGDGRPDVIDNCIFAANPGQADSNADGVGDACELSPSAECVDSLGGGRYRAVFGYRNAKRGGVRIPVGPANKFATGPADQGQVRDFIMGRWHRAFEAEFTSSSLTWLLGGRPAKASSTGLPTCQGDPDGDGIPTSEDNCPFVSNVDQSDLDGNGTGDVCAADDILGFEDPSHWRTLVGTTTLDFSFEHTQGAGALSVKSSNFVELTSSTMSTAQVRGRFEVANPTRIRYDLFVPSPAPNPHWIGFTQLYVSCPSAGINHQYIGQLELTGLPTNAWRTVSLALPAQVLTALKSNRNDFSIQIAINAPPAVQGFALDNVRFGN